MYFFFFQAEDGIRDKLVTGVQTCALPISARGGNQREADVAEAFRRAVDDLLAQRPDLILFAGDVFHSVRPTNPAILFLFRELQRVRVALPETPIVLIAGNHDTPRSVETGTILKLYE